MKGWMYRKVKGTARWRRNGKEWTYSVVIPHMKVKDGKQFFCFDNTCWRAVIAMIKQKSDGTYKFVTIPHVSLAYWWDFTHDFSTKQTLPQAMAFVENGWLDGEIAW